LKIIPDSGTVRDKSLQRPPLLKAWHTTEDASSEMVELMHLLQLDVTTIVANQEDDPKSAKKSHILNKENFKRFILLFFSGMVHFWHLKKR